MRSDERMNPLVTLAAAAMGIAIGLVVQFALSGRGAAPFVPPLSLAIMLALIAGVLLTLGIRLRRTVLKRAGAVNPFLAVRLLATARAGQLVGGFLGGFGGGLALSLLGRSVPAPVSSWLPMVLVFATGAALVVCAAITEHLCRIPPGDGDTPEASEPEAGPSGQTAYRKP
ncbi:DUF3180 family protein [Leucobacter luti]|uniref:Uncharacterized protein DUF3180 n=1 Tax=Leucobacter luti TaxID=340320 RepID=A0A4R6S3Z4_9MICO|nr:DUF3180 family protein [Leucobacter luti]QYM76750.1 DUF3180 domain-containing protein [Leucobacter luti]TDP94361.1 uncharacterized protein DUF3180 [Leucobacter luti]